MFGFATVTVRGEASPAVYRKLQIYTASLIAGAPRSYVRNARARQLA